MDRWLLSAILALGCTSAIAQPLTFDASTVGGPVQAFANPNATHTVAVPFTAPVTAGAIVLAVILAIAAALAAGSLGGWRITHLRPAQALSRVA